VPTYERERLASDAEVRRALVKSLRAFGVRVTAKDLRAQSVRGKDEQGDECDGPSTIPGSA
jgi:hypothetical protein